MRQCELRWRGVFNSGVGIATIDMKGRFLRANRAFQRMSGYSERELTTRSVQDLTDEQDRETSRKQVTRLLKRRSGRVEVEERYRRKDGTVVRVHADLSLVRRTDGRPHYMMEVIADINGRKEADRELEQPPNQLRALAGRLQRVREEERKRVARQIHDELGQALTSIKLDLSSLLRGTVAGGDEQMTKAESLLRRLDDTVGAVHRIATELRPGALDDLGLAAAIEWAAQEFQNHSGIQCSLNLPRTELGAHPERDIAVFRILQETLTNIARHAQATLMRVRLTEKKGTLTLEVRDNGRGISPAQISDVRSLGILGMRERAALLGGELAIQGVPRKGTTVTVRIPQAQPGHRERL
ncbi:MAG TPA: PAS domain S-box protein [Terriglobia bacterium]|nr:PAS domain S-box protein [Terriglobia bacterium]